MKHQTISTASGKTDAPRSLKDALAPALAAARKRDVIDVRQPAEPRLGPTPEQRAKADYVRKGGKVEKGQVGEAAYTRQYLFEKLAKTHGISEAGLAALRFYRKAHEEQDASPTRCALNDEGRGGGVPLCLPFSISGMLLEDLAGGTLVDALERRLGHTLTTMRAGRRAAVESGVAQLSDNDRERVNAFLRTRGLGTRFAADGSTYQEAPVSEDDQAAEAKAA